MSFCDFASIHYNLQAYSAVQNLLAVALLFDCLSGFGLLLCLGPVPSLDSGSEPGFSLTLHDGFLWFHHGCWILVICSFDRPDLFKRRMKGLCFWLDCPVSYCFPTQQPTAYTERGGLHLVSRDHPPSCAHLGSSFLSPG